MGEWNESILSSNSPIMDEIVELLSVALCSAFDVTYAPRNDHLNVVSLRQTIGCIPNLGLDSPKNGVGLPPSCSFLLERG